MSEISNEDKARIFARAYRDLQQARRVDEPRTVFDFSGWGHVHVISSWNMLRDCWGAYDHWPRIGFSELYAVLDGQRGPGTFVLEPR